MISSVAKVINPAWLTGPILDKELRIASRRRRSYVLRSGYLVLLIILVAVAWATTVLTGSRTSTTWQTSRMGEIGWALVLTITWSQFLAAQILAAVMLSNSIGDEIRRRTIDVLMTTPINCVQIVLGKLFSRLFQLILLLAVALPLLAVIRVFGGIQWEHVVSALSITVTATIFVGSLSMFLSTKVHRPYLVILIMTILLVVAYSVGSLPFVFGVWSSTFASIMQHVNPFAAMMRISRGAFSGTGMAGAYFSLPLHCLTIAAASLLVLFASAYGLRRSALETVLAADAHGESSFWKRLAMASLFGARRFSSTAYTIRPVKGSPIIWKELARPFRQSLGANVIAFVILSAILLAICSTIYVLKSSSATPSASFGLYNMFTGGLRLIATIRTASMAATSVAKEKEAHTLPILLGTSLEPEQIIRGKALIAFWRNAPAWLILALATPAFYLLVMTTDPSIRFGRFVVFHVFMSPLDLAAYVVFLVGLGLYFSVRLKSSTSAVIATIGSLLGLIVVRRFAYTLLSVLVVRTAARGFETGYVMIQIVTIAAHAIIGLLLLRRAQRRLRPNIF